MTILNNSIPFVPVQPGWMYEYTQEILITPGSPWVNSISYGWYANIYLSLLYEILSYF